MPITLENAALQLTIDPANACWDITTHLGQYPTLEGVRMGVRYRAGPGMARGLDQWITPQVRGPEMMDSLPGCSISNGPLRVITLHTSQNRQGLRFLITFALAQQPALLLWKVEIENNSLQPVYLDRIEMLNVGHIPNRLPPPAGQKSTIRNLQSNPAFFSNGWQSWNFTGAYGLSDRFRRTRLGPLHTPMRVNHGTPHPRAKGHFGSDMFGIYGDRTARTAVLVGFLSQKQHFGSLEAYLDEEASALSLWANGDGVRLNPGAAIATDWAVLHFLDLDSPHPLAPYLDASARENALPTPHSILPTPPSLTGWCSWYRFFQKVTAEEVRRNLQTAAELKSEIPIESFEIDDGFEAQIGDWFAFNPKFPDGVSPLAAEIRQKGFRPGLWLAPFIVHPKSRLISTNPDWILRNRWGRPVNAGFVLDALNTALDLTHPEALQYAVDVVHTASHEWGYPFLKLDFLYAAALPGRYRDPTRSRAQVLRAGLEALRAAAGEETTLLGCGCPLGPAVGLVDVMRIGCDTDPYWYPRWNGIGFFFHQEPDMPSARNALQNALTRAPLHHRWWVNDPDCLLLNPSAYQSRALIRGSTVVLTLDEIHTQAAIIALTGGALLLSDDLPEVPPERLRIAQQLLPVIGCTPRVPDWFDATTPSHLRLDLEGPAGPWSLLALFNWEDHPCEMTVKLADYNLPDREYYAHEFWPQLPSGGSPARLKSGFLTFPAVPAHGTVLLALRPVVYDQPQYLGSDLHISQGLEVAEWQADSNGLHLRLVRPGRAEGQIVLALPTSPTTATLNGQPLPWETAGEGCYQFAVKFEQEAQIEIR